MIGLALVGAALAVTGLAERPSDLTGGDAAGYSAWLRSEAVKLEAEQTGAGACADAQVSSTLMYNLGDGLTDHGAGLTGPSVLERVRVAGCGRDGQYNLVAARVEKGGWRAVAMLPGESNTDPVLQRDVVTMVVPIVTSAPPKLSCDVRKVPLQIGQIRLVSPPDASGGWVEVWPFKACGTDRAVEITFTHSYRDGGTDFNGRALWDTNAR